MGNAIIPSMINHPTNYQIIPGFRYTVVTDSMSCNARSTIEKQDRLDLQIINSLEGLERLANDGKAVVIEKKDGTIILGMITAFSNGIFSIDFQNPRFTKHDLPKHECKAIYEIVWYSRDI